VGFIGQLDAPTDLPRGKALLSILTGGQMGPRAVLNLPGNQTMVIFRNVSIKISLPAQFLSPLVSKQSAFRHFTYRLHFPVIYFPEMTAASPYPFSHSYT
jgi:hypothetical protein